MNQDNPAHIAAMHAAHGITEGRTCGECAQCVDRRRTHSGRAAGVTNYVCLKAPVRTTGHGEARRRVWLKKAQACGLFVEGGL